jgi:exoribonuclease-2
VSTAPRTTVTITPGELVAWWQGNNLAMGALVAEEKGKVALILTSGKMAKVPVARVVFRLGRLEISSSTPPGSDSFRQVAMSALRQLEDDSAGLSAQVEVGVLWELVQEEGDALAPEALASLALDQEGGLAIVATLRAVLAEGACFSRKGDSWIARPTEAVQAIFVQREADHRREQEQADLFAWFAEPTGDIPAGKLATRYLMALDRVALNQGEPDRDNDNMAREVLKLTGSRFDRLDEGAFRYLLQIGRFKDPDENLQMLRYDLRVAFPEDVLKEAESAATAGFSREGRTDLTGMAMMTIDSSSTREIDDGLSIESTDRGGLRVGIHIADPCAFIPAGGAVDREAMRRGLTHYFPETRLTMIPAVISESAASLVEGQDRPAISFMADLDESGAVVSWELLRSVVRCTVRRTYDEIDQSIEDYPLLDLFRSLRESYRQNEGAILMFSPELELSVDPPGQCRIRNLDPLSLSRRAVSEAMILAGDLAARFCVDRNLPVIFRKQDRPEGDLVRPGAPVTDLIEARNIRMRLKRGEATLKPSRHDALALTAYVQATSPLRRYMDLVAHRQITTELTGAEPHFAQADLGGILSVTSKAEADARKAERQRVEYWILRYVEDQLEQGNDILDAVVVQVKPRVMVHLSALAIDRASRNLSGVAPGDLVRMQVQRVNPRAGILSLSPVGQSG